MGKRTNKDLLPFHVIAAASGGNADAMCTVLKHYDGYIAKLCTRTMRDNDGNTHAYIDEEMRNRLKIRLITRTLSFRIS